ncbi:MAG TPA: TonB-dependent receptor, partial [Pyrinomonadaceae bacterium]|nr:TonB-dependent receptor [Pyrinomonadaceae bacterium]
SLRIELKVGAVGGQVEVRADAVAVRTDPAVATTIDRTFVQNLPLNGRSFSSLVLLTPGVTVASSPEDSGQFSVNGQRASTNYFTVDGVGANLGISTNIGGAKSLELSGAYPSVNIVGGTNNLVSIDALEEFKIQTSTYTAESGRQPGGQVQIVTRSGKNQFHGVLFEYFRNEGLDARNYFNTKPAPETPLRQNQFGGTFSGPIFLPSFGEGGRSFYKGKDRTFFFFSFEAQRLRLPNNRVINVPSLRLRQVAATALQPLLNAFPIPTGSETVSTTPCTLPNPRCDPITLRLYSGTAPYNFNESDPTNLASTGIRIDHTVNSRLSLFGRFNESPSDRLTQVVPRFQTFANTRTLTLGATSVFNTGLTNELRFNYSRSQAKGDTVQPAFGGAIPIDPGVLTSGLPGLGSVSFNTGVGFSLQGGVTSDSYQSQINIVDNLSVLLGGHNLKFGLDLRRLSPIYGANDRQAVTFGQETAIQTGIVSSLSITTSQPSEPQFDNYSFYAQDSWRASRRLTLDLGLRWEINPAPSEAADRMPPIVLGGVGPDLTGAILAPPGTQFYKIFWTAFAPRIGAAYQLRTTPGRETVLRGGFGIYYDLGSGTAGSGWPIQATRSLPSPLFPACAAPIVFPVPPACLVRPGIAPITVPTTSRVTSPNENLKLPYSLHWNLAIEQSLGKEQTVSVSYVASAGRRLLTQLTVNRQRRDPLTGALLPRPNTNFGDIVYSFNGPTSDYHSMQAQYRARLPQGLQVLMNYTWSHAIDEVSTDLLFSPALGGILERGNANFDVRHNFSAAVNYDLPMTDAVPVLSQIFRNWTLSAIVHAQSGRPVNISGGNFVDEDGTFFSTRPDYIAGTPLYINDPNAPGGRRFNSAAFTRPPGVPGSPTTPARQGTFGRNVMRELPLYQLDIALGRTFRFTEKVGLQVKGEAFNAFNHPMFAGYRTSFTVPGTFGVPSTTLNSGLGGLNSLYQLGGSRSIQLSARLSF